MTSSPSASVSPPPRPAQNSRKLFTVCLVLLAICYAIFLGVRLRYAAWNPGVFVNVGETFTYKNHSDLPPGVPVNSQYGYDGQFFYRLASGPFTRSRASRGIVLDNPPYRHQRLGYPLLVSVVALGQQSLVPWAMLLVNFAAVIALGYVGMLYARQINIAPQWGLMFAVCPGYLFTLSRDLAELVQAAFLLTALYLLRRDRPLLATGSLVAAFLTRETALLAAVACMPVLILNFRGLSAHPALQSLTRRFTVAAPPGLRWQFLLIPFAIFVVWQAVLYYLWGAIPVRSHPQPFEPFFAGLKTFLGNATQPGTYHRFWLLEAFFWAAFALVAVLALPRSRALLHEKLLFGFHLVLASAFGYDLWREDWGYMRLLIELFLAGWLVLLNGSLRLRIVAAVLSVGMWLLVILHLLGTGR